MIQFRRMNAAYRSPLVNQIGNVLERQGCIRLAGRYDLIAINPGSFGVAANWNLH